MLAIHAFKIEFILVEVHLDMDKASVLIADAMLEGVLYKVDCEQGRHHGIGYLLLTVNADLNLLGEAQAHQFDIAVYELILALQGHERLVCLIEQIAHHLGELDKCVFRFFWIDVYEGMDVVERVHEEMWADLIFQILQLLLHILAFQLLQQHSVLLSLEEDFDSNIESEETEEH